MQLSLFDERDLAEISAPAMFPGERLIVCRNRELAAERQRKREELLTATERDLARIQAQVRRKRAPLRGAAAIGMAVGAVVNNRKVAKHFAIEIGDSHLTVQRRAAQIEQEARLDGIYVIRTSVPAEQLDTEEAVQAYKDLSRVERAFRSLKTIDLEIRPIRHWTADRVRSHVFLCMLAYHVEWHLRDALAPLLFHDTELAATRSERSSPIAVDLVTLGIQLIERLLLLFGRRGLDAVEGAQRIPCNVRHDLRIRCSPPPSPAPSMPSRASTPAPKARQYSYPVAQ